MGIDFWLAMGIVPNLRSDSWTFSSSPPHSVALNSISAREHLTQTQMKQLDALIMEYFQLMKGKIGCTSLVEHKITVMTS